MIFEIFVIILIIAIFVYIFLNEKSKGYIFNLIDENYGSINNINNEINFIKNNYVKHGEKITIRSSVHQKHRLQDHGNKQAKFENSNRGGWEQLVIEKCSLPGIIDKQKCWE